MSRNKRKRSETGIYHVMQRGNERKNVFQDDEDKSRYLETIRQIKQEQRFSLHAYCLMDNHIHLMIKEGTEEIGKIMKRIAVSYAFYYNQKYKRVGHLFQDRFKSENVESDGYILSLARYIHQNPVKAGLTETPSKYRWSSYNEYLSESRSDILDSEFVIGLFSSNKEKARSLFIDYMNQDSDEAFMDLLEEEIEMDEDKAKELYQTMLRNKGIVTGIGEKVKIPDDFIKEFKLKTRLSVRKIAVITGVNKDKVSKITRNNK